MKKNIFLVILVACALVLTGAGKKPVTLYMVGDSTMADKTELEESPERGWGQLFPTYLTENVIVANYAKNGRSTRSFIAEGRWQKVVDNLHRGDVVLIQFGHNDTKQSDSTRYASIADYEANLMKMVEDAQKKKASVIICTPIARRYFKDGEFHPRHGGYPEAARRVAKRMNVPVLDLEKTTNEWIQGLGDEGSAPYFMNVAPGECTKYPEGREDNTHLRENGALVVGKMAAQMILDQKIKPLYQYITLENTTPKYTTVVEN